MVKNRGGKGKRQKIRPQNGRKKHKGEKMKKIQRIILAFMLGIVPLQSTLADSKADALANAALDGKLEQVKTLIEQEGVDINARESEIGATALMGASMEGHLEVVQYLIDKGADIDAKADNGITALLVASSKGHLEAVKYLISKGSNINAVASNGTDNFTALDVAKINKHYKIAEVLRKAGAKSAKAIKK